MRLSGKPRLGRRGARLDVPYRPFRRSSASSQAQWSISPAASRTKASARRCRASLLRTVASAGARASGYATADSTSWAPLVEAGRLRLLVTWGERRAKRFPEVPTLREVGIDIVSASPYGFAGPKGMDAGVVRTLHGAFKAALFDPAHLAVLERYDMEPAYMNSEDYAAFARRQYQEEGEMIRRLGLRVD